MTTSKRRKRLAKAVGPFIKEYGRKKEKGGGRDPNDRHYDRGLEAELKRLQPEEFDKLLHDDADDTGSA